MTLTFWLSSLVVLATLSLLIRSLCENSYEKGRSKGWGEGHLCGFNKGRSAANRQFQAQLDQANAELGKRLSTERLKTLTQKLGFSACEIIELSEAGLL